MTDRSTEVSPQIYARIGGVLYLTIIVAGGFGEGVARPRLIVSGDVAATAKNIMASEWLWRIAFAGEMTIYVCAVPLVMIFYVLLSPVNRNIALLAAFLGGDFAIRPIVYIRFLRTAQVEPKFSPRKQVTDR